MARKNQTAKRVARKKDTRPAKKTTRRLTVARALESKPTEPEPPKVEVSVRHIYHADQFRPALCFRRPGELHVPAIIGDPVSGVRHIRLTSYHHDKCNVVQHGPGPYPPARFIERMRELARVAITPEARRLLLPLAPDMPSGPQPAALPPSEPVARPVAARNASESRAGPSRTSGKELIRALANASKLPPEKVRAKLRAAGMRAPYVDEAACRKALGLSKGGG